MSGSRTGTTQWLRVRARLIRDRPHVCHWCHRDLSAKVPPYDPAAIQVDHLLPYSTHPHLQYDEENLVLACRPCNRSKGAKASPGGLRRTRDENGILILDPSVVCFVHDPIKASCPHSGALR